MAVQTDCKSVTKEIKALQLHDKPSAVGIVKEPLGMDGIRLNIAITGESGSGKSTFVNAFRGLCDDDEGAAPTGLTESSMDPMPYFHPNYPNVTLWDLPGIGTLKYPADTYLKDVKFEKYDFFIIMSDTRFRENDVKLAREIQRMKKKFYFVRSKIDNDLRAERRNRDFSEERTLTKIRDDCVKGLRGLGVESPQVFLVSSFELHLYDFSLLQQTLDKERLKIKRETLLFLFPNINPEIIRKKKKTLKSTIIGYAFGSAAGAAVPLPGLSVAVDAAVLVGAVTHFVHEFGLDIPSLKRLSARTGVHYDDLQAAIVSQLAAVEITAELLLKVVAQLGSVAALIAAEEVSRFIPFIGIPVSAGLSFTTTYKILILILDKIAEDAQRVSERVLV
ncbi:interferon-inducible GTPase 5-like [Pelmatolapia mariae]|uniref:interferon-inducible GTPase 5-like n=1 Tax=Pelmatolapia mariae TaxID=158779 RepID=UPI002FE65DC5